MRRRPGTLTELEGQILYVLALAKARGEAGLHGFGIARQLEQQGLRPINRTGYGTLYRALSRLETAGQVIGEWEEPSVAEEARRPRRRIYELTPAGSAALERVSISHAATEGALSTI